MSLMSLGACFPGIPESQPQAHSLLCLLSICSSLPPLPPPLRPLHWFCSGSVGRYELHFSVQHRQPGPASPTSQAILGASELWSTGQRFYSSFLERCLVFQGILPEKVLLFILKVPVCTLLLPSGFFSRLKLLQFNFTVW